MKAALVILLLVAAVIGWRVLQSPAHWRNWYARRAVPKGWKQ